MDCIRFLPAKGLDIEGGSRHALSACGKNSSGLNVPVESAAQYKNFIKLFPIAVPFDPIFWLFADSHAKHTTSQQMWEPFHL